MQGSEAGLMTKRADAQGVFPVLFKPEDIVQAICPSGGVTGYTLREAIRRGQLEAYTIGGAYYVTEEDVRSWLKRCRGKRKGRDCGFAEDQVVERSGSSETDRNTLARAALKRIARELKDV